MDLSPLPMRKNRRRERPGQRTRKALSQRGLQRMDFADAQDVAHTPSIWLPGEKQPPCLCKACFWERAHFAGQADDEMEKNQANYREEANDEELRRMGILYNVDEGAISESVIRSPIPEEFSIRYVRPKRNPRSQFQLPAYLAASLLGESPAIAQWILKSTMIPTPTASDSITPATQFWSRFPRNQLQSQSQSQSQPLSQFQFPRSLPPTFSNSVSHFHRSGTSDSQSASAQQQSPQAFLPHLFPLNNDDEDLNESTWDFITNSTRPGSPALSLISIPATPSISTPALSSVTPERWIMLSDDL